MTTKTKNWYGSVEDHLRIYTPSVGAYLFRGIGTFVVVAVLFPPARFLGAAIVGIAMVVVECVVYQIVWAIHLRRLRRKYPNRPHQ